MTTRNLTDDLLSIARASFPGEMPNRLRQILLDPDVPREEIAEKARYAISLLRLQAKTLRQMAFPSLTSDHARAMGLDGWIVETRALSDDLMRDAASFEEMLIAEGVLMRGEAQPQTLRGLWKGASISDEDITEARVSWGKAAPTNERT